MKSKYKLTGCSRFLIFLLVFTPVVYFGVHFFQGENAIQKLKDLWSDKSPDKTIDTDRFLGNKKKSRTAVGLHELKLKDTEIEALKDHVERLEKALENCK